MLAFLKTRVLQIIVKFTVIMVLVIHKAMIIVLWKVWPMLKSIINFPKIVRSSLKKRNIATVYPLITATVVSTSMLTYVHNRVLGYHDVNKTHYHGLVYPTGLFSLLYQLLQYITCVAIIIPNGLK